MPPRDSPTTPEATEEEIRLARQWLRMNYPGASDPTVMSLAALLAAHRALTRHRIAKP
jgi:hypothetical protein